MRQAGGRCRKARRSSALLALTFFPLAVVPFGVNVAAAGVIAFGLGLMARDGLLVAIGYAFCIATLYVLATAR